jgi:hypothetical protein
VSILPVHPSTDGGGCPANCAYVLLELEFVSSFISFTLEISSFILEARLYQSNKISDVRTFKDQNGYRSRNTYTRKKGDRGLKN